MIVEASSGTGKLRVAEACDWTFNKALPYWAENGVDRLNNGFVEHLDLSGRDAGVPFKRVRAQARQIYVFAHAALRGWSQGASLAWQGWDFLCANGRREDGAWVRRLGRAGGIFDPTCDAYDMAFVLFAHAWLYRLDRSPDILRSALATLDALDSVLAHESGLGWHAFERCGAAREQNPHMHLVEAAIELADATGHDRFHDLADRGLTLFEHRLLDRAHGVVREHYQADWGGPCPLRGHVVEPGHMLEWSWILCRGKALLGRSTGDLSQSLYYRALALGERPDGLIVDQVSDAGQVLAAGCRAWPQTEALKAHLVAYERGEVLSLARARRSLDHLLDRYLSCQPAGCWIDQLDEQLHPQVDKIPATTFYHLFLALSELDRVGLPGASRSGLPAR